MLEQTKNQISEVKLFGMLKTVDLRLQESQDQGWSGSDLLVALITDERNYREINKINRRLKSANFRSQANFESLDFAANRSFNKSEIKELMHLNFIKASPRNIIITGPAGIEKTFLATALGHQACRRGFTTLFMGVSIFIEKLLMT